MQGHCTSIERKTGVRSKRGRSFAKWLFFESEAIVMAVNIDYKILGPQTLLPGFTAVPPRTCTFQRCSMRQKNLLK